LVSGGRSGGGLVRREHRPRQAPLGEVGRGGAGRLLERHDLDVDEAELFKVRLEVKFVESGHVRLVVALYLGKNHHTR
jgi:hypothetical protein